MLQLKIKKKELISKRCGEDLSKYSAYLVYLSEYTKPKRLINAVGRIVQEHSEIVINPFLHKMSPKRNSEWGSRHFTCIKLMVYRFSNSYVKNIIL